MPKKSRKRLSKNRQVHWLLTPMLWLLGVGVFVGLTYVGYLDYTVKAKFEGKRWALPAKVYASPTEMYSGLSITAEQFEYLLRQLHYQQNSKLPTVGTYYRKANSVTIRTRDFDFWDQRQRSRKLAVQFDGDSIDDINDLDTDTEVAILRMEPVLIGSFYPSQKEDRILIKLDDAPKALLGGLLATEDRNFYQHYGVSPKAIGRALWSNLKAQQVVQGGSTITQQLVKNFYLNADKNLWRKAKEALMALLLEYHYQKDEILQAYLNEIYLGQNASSAIHGFGLAADFYFGRQLADLHLDEIATLIALVRGPSYYDPRRQHKRAVKRRNLVLDTMATFGTISPASAAKAKVRPLNIIARRRDLANRYPGFLDLVKRQIQQEYAEDVLTSRGLRIFTTLDTRIQNTLEKTIATSLNDLEADPQTNKLQTAAIVSRRDNGEIVALAGDRNRKGVGFNRALDATRSIGSLIKPVVYLTALQQPDKYTLTTLIDDKPVAIKGRNGEYWRPKNYDKKTHGKVRLHLALAHSYNLATVHLGMAVGLGKVAKTLAAMGASRQVNLYPSMLLGASLLTPFEITQVYQTLAGDGFATPLRSIRAVMATNGNRLQRYPYTVRQAVSPAAVYLTNKILQQAMREGTGRSVYRHLPSSLNLVGKTGTSNKLRDSWFAGFSGDYLAVSWIGRDDNQPTGLTGSSGALQLWARLMKQISSQPVQLAPPDNIQTHWITADGLLANKGCSGVVPYPFVAGSEPKHIDSCVGGSINKASNWLQNLFGE